MERNSTHINFNPQIIKISFLYPTADIRFLYLFCIIIAALILAPNHLFAYGRPTPINILPEGKSALYIILASKNNSSVQYNNSNGKIISRSANSSQVIKTVLKSTLAKNIEFSLQVPRVIDRTLQVTEANGQIFNKYNGENGLGDVAIALTYQWSDMRTEAFGLITGAELKLATGNEEKGLGSGGNDLILRTALTKKTGAGAPYLIAIYTMSGDGRINGVDTNMGDDLYLAAGFRTRTWHGFGLDLRGFTYIRTNDMVKESSGQQAFYEKYNIPGCKGELRYKPNKRVEFNLFYEGTYPKTDNYTVGSQSFHKDSDRQDTIGMVVKFYW